MTKKKKIGLILGSGELATHCMEQLVYLDYDITIARLPCSKVKIKKNIDFIDIKYEQINEAFSFLRRKKIYEIALIGYIERPEINFKKVTLASKKILLKVFESLNKGDGAIFSSVKEMLIDQNFTTVKVQDLLPELTLASGIYGFSPETNDVLHEIDTGVKFFFNYAKLDVGQSLIFQRGHCLGMETITGTDEMIRTLINFRKKNDKISKKPLPGGILIKGSKPDQILDIDTPVIGPNTVELAKKAKLTGLVIESKKVIVVNRKLIINMLKDYRMFLVATNFLNKDL